MAEAGAFRVFVPMLSSLQLAAIASVLLEHDFISFTTLSHRPRT